MTARATSSNSAKSRADIGQVCQARLVTGPDVSLEANKTGTRFALESPTGLNPPVLFLCVHNAGRSQMAAGFMRHLSQGRVDVFSGGSEPAVSLNQVVVEAMAERGVDIGGELPQPRADEIIRAADIVVTMGFGDACPVFPGKRYVDWDLEDPAGKPIETVRKIRDEIERRVVRLLEEVTEPAEKAT